MKPLIGITTSEVRVPDHVSPAPQADPPRREMALGMKYTMAVEAAGGVPVVMPPMHDEAVGPLLDRLSGVVLSGGPEIADRLEKTGYAEWGHAEEEPKEVA